MSVDVEQKCPDCGSVIPSGAAHCPACALGRAIGGEDSLADLTGDTTSSLDMSPVTEVAGDSIGPYKLLEKIGEGGFGVVYMAKQEKPVRRQVALKIVKLGMDTKQVVGRFEAERQALALMEHPSIAKVLDAGSTEAGRPYFVMELVHGVPITEFCNENRLTTEERLKLFVKVCHAVQHAHQKGVIHRDLKPSNILVTMHDDEAVPKVIDFGIAKATQHDLTDKTLFTQFRHFLGTPAYMSPEQAQMSGLGVDTRSDIYSLGVLLYELLTGCTPLDLKPAMESGYDEVRRTIREVEPMKPSAFVSQLSGAKQTTLSKQSRMSEGALHSQLRGDLDWVVMKAIEKDRSRRYGTAELFAQDVAAFLRDDPVSAVAPSPWYLLSKLAKRNKPIFVSVGLSIPALLLAAIFSFLMWGQERREKLQSDEYKENLKQRLEKELQLGYARDVRTAADLIESGRFTEANQVLDRHVPQTAVGPEDKDRREFAWYYLKGKARRSQLTGLPGLHSERASHLVFSPDGRWLVSAAETEVFLWDTLERSLAQRLDKSLSKPESPKRYWRYPEFSTDGRYLVLREVKSVLDESDDNLEVAVWKLENGSYRRTPCSARFSRSTQYSRAATGRRYRIVQDGVRFIPDTHQLVLAIAPQQSTAKGPGVSVYDLDADREVFPLEGAGVILDISPDGDRLLTRRWHDNLPELALWDLGSRSLLGRSDAFPNAMSVYFADENWLLAYDPVVGQKFLLNANTLERGPDWLSLQLDGSYIEKARQGTSYFVRGEESLIMDATTFKHQSLEYNNSRFAIALHPEGKFFASLDPNPNETSIRFIPVNLQQSRRSLEITDGNLVFHPGGGEVLVNERGKDTIQAHTLPEMDSVRDTKIEGDIVSWIADDEIWYLRSLSHEPDLFWVGRTGDHFENNSFETNAQVKDIWELRSGNLLVFYDRPASVEVRDRETLRVLSSHEIAGDATISRSLSALAKSEDVLGLYQSGDDVTDSYEFLRAETLEIIAFSAVRKDDALVDIAYVAADGLFVLFYESGWVDEIDSSTLERSDSYQIPAGVEFAAVSHDGRSIAVTRTVFPKVEIYCRRTRSLMVELERSTFVAGYDLKFTPADDGIFIVPAWWMNASVTAWWPAPR